MGWKLDNPLYSMADEEEARQAIELWSSEKTGGMWEGNNRLPFPLTFLIALIICTAFLVTMPIWGQRPTVKLYAPMVDLMDSAEVKALATPAEKMKYLTDKTMAAHKADPDTRLPGLLERHPISWDDLNMIKTQVRELQDEVKSGKARLSLDNYTVVGPQVVLANFEGNWIDKSTHLRERVQPWWDMGYTIDVFYVSYFIIAMVIVCKRLPHFTRKPDMSKAT